MCRESLMRAGYRQEEEAGETVSDERGSWPDTMAPGGQHIPVVFGASV